MNFAEAMNEVTGWKRTENGAVAREIGIVAAS